jgi:hypothetical protein
MIVLDLNQVLLANFFASVGKHTNIAIEPSLMRHMVLNTIRAINVKFRREYGDLVIAADSKANWRKEYYPYYKANRKQTRDKSDIDWKSVFECMDMIKSDLQEFFPYKFIQIEGCEADDVIGTLIRKPSEPHVGNHIIISGDKDFKQLQTSQYIHQYDPIQKKYIKETDPAEYLETHILEGDRSDGVPNVLSEDNCMVIGIRQGRMTQRRRDELKGIEDRPNDKYYRNWIRNRTLIDLNFTPQGLQDQIRAHYVEYQPASKSKLMPYLMKHGMNSLTENINDF